MGKDTAEEQGSRGKALVSAFLRDGKSRPRLGSDGCLAMADHHRRRCVVQIARLLDDESPWLAKWEAMDVRGVWNDLAEFTISLFPDMASWAYHEDLHVSSGGPRSYVSAESLISALDSERSMSIDDIDRDCLLNSFESMIAAAAAEDYDAFVQNYVSILDVLEIELETIQRRNFKIEFPVRAVALAKSIDATPRAEGAPTAKVSDQPVDIMSFLNREAPSSENKRRLDS